jgi:hypothetical protein
VADKLPGKRFSIGWKPVTGAALIGLALFAFSQNLLRTVATEAYVNAALASVASPIPGRVSQALTPIGSRVSPGFELRVLDERADLSVSIEVDSKLAQVDADIAASELKLAAIDRARGQFARWTEQFGSAKGSFLDRRVKQAEALTEVRRAESMRADDNLRRLQSLPEGEVAQREVIAAQATATAASNELAAQEAEQQSLVISRQALRQGVQLTEGLPDRTYSDQKVQELALDLATEQAKHKGLLMQREMLQRSQQLSREALQSRREARIPVPEGIVWRRVPENSFVAAGGALGAVAVCSEIVLTATLSRRDSQRVYVGQKVSAVLRLPEAERLELEGSVVGLAGPTIENAQGMAIPFGRAASTDGYGAVVRVDQPERLQCRVGAPVRLEFER